MPVNAYIHEKKTLILEPFLHWAAALFHNHSFHDTISSAFSTIHHEWNHHCCGWKWEAWLYLYPLYWTHRDDTLWNCLHEFIQYDDPLVMPSVLHFNTVDIHDQALSIFISTTRLAHPITSYSLYTRFCRLHQTHSWHDWAVNEARFLLSTDPVTHTVPTDHSNYNSEVSGRTVITSIIPSGKD